MLNRRVWTRQPQVAVGVDWGNPLTRGLVVCVSPTLRVNSARGIILPGTVSAISGVGANLGAYYADKVASASSISFNPATNGYSVFLWFKTPTFIPSLAHGGYGIYTSGYAGGLYLEHGNSAYAGAFWSGSGFDVIGKPTGATFVDLTEYKVGLSHFVGTATRLFANGAGSNGTSRALPNAAITEISLGSTRGTTTETAYPGTKFILFCMWSRALSDVEHRELANNPWQLFAPLSRPVFAPSAAAASIYTLSNATYQPGSIAAYGVVPQVDVTVT